MANYPTSLDSLTNPVPGDPTTSVTVPHATQHATANDILEQLEAKLGIGASTPNTNTLMRGTAAGVSSYGAPNVAMLGGGGAANKILTTADGVTPLWAGPNVAMLGGGGAADTMLVSADGVTPLWSRPTVAQLSAYQAGITNMVFLTYDGINPGWGKVNSANIEDASIAYTDIGTGQIITSLLSDGSVTTPKIADNTISTVKLQANTITGTTVLTFTGSVMSGTASAAMSGSGLNFSTIGGPVLAVLNGSLYGSTSGQYVAITIGYDGLTPLTELAIISSPGPSYFCTFCVAALIYPAPGSHTFVGLWRVSGGGHSVTLNAATFSLTEFKR